MGRKCSAAFIARAAFLFCSTGHLSYYRDGSRIYFNCRLSVELRRWDASMHRKNKSSYYR